ncbi:hypothetical protein ACQ4PT_039988 [Festuca glaucescens]
MEDHQNPSLSASTMWILGVEEGVGDCLLKVEIKYLAIPKDFVYALRVANIPDVKWAVDEDGSLYMKFRNHLESDFTSIHHFFIGGRMMLKFHRVVTTRKIHPVFDGSMKPICSSIQINKDEHTPKKNEVLKPKELSEEIIRMIIRTVQKSKRRNSATKKKRKRINMKPAEGNGSDADGETKAYSRCSTSFLFKVRDISETIYELDKNTAPKLIATQSLMHQSIDNSIGDLLGEKLKEVVASSFARIMENEDTNVCKKAEKLVIEVIHALLSDKPSSQETVKLACSGGCGSQETEKLGSSEQCSYQTANESMSRSSLPSAKKHDCEDDVDVDALIRRKRRRVVTINTIVAKEAIMRCKDAENNNFGYGMETPAASKQGMSKDITVDDNAIIECDTSVHCAQKELIIACLTFSPKRPISHIDHFVDLLTPEVPIISQEHHDNKQSSTSDWKNYEESPEIQLIGERMKSSLEIKETWLEAGLKQMDFSSFGRAYPNVPKQKTGNDCSIFGMKFLERFEPRNAAHCNFSHLDVPAFRVRYAHDMLLNENNTEEDKKIEAAEFH